MSDEDTLIDTSDDSLDPAVIPGVGPSLLNDTYEVAIAKLKKLYTDNEWIDKEVAAQNVSELASSLNEYHGIKPEVALTSDAAHLSGKMLDRNLTEDTKIAAIEDWRTKSKEGIYNTDDAESLISGKAKEELVDQYAQELRRGVVAGDVGMATDLMARGAEHALAPLFGAPDAILGTNLKEPFKEKLQEFENPKYDDTIPAQAASILGSVGGFAASSLTPLTAWGYLGATVVDQGKEVYDTALKASGSEDAAQEALLRSSPGLVINAFSGHLVGGTLGSLLKGERGYVGALIGGAAGGVGAGAQEAAVSSALSITTGKKEFEPSLAKIGTQALIGTAIGGIVGGIGDIKSEVQIHKANREIQETLGVKTVPGDPETPSAIGAFVKKQEEFKASPTSERSEDALELKDNLLGSVKIAEPPKEGATEALSSLTQNDGGVEKVLSVAPEFYTPQPYMLELIRQLDGKVSLQDLENSFGFYDPTTNAIVVRRSIFKDLPAAYSTFAHELGHMIDFYSKSEGVVDALKVKGMHDEPVLMKLVRLNAALQGKFDEGTVQAEARNLSAEWRSGWEGAPTVPKEWEVNPPAPTTPEAQQKAYLEYRNRSTEIQADTISAILNNPAHVQANYPELWKAFEAGLETQPNVKKFWEEVVAINQDPRKFQDWFQKQREEGRLAEAHIVKQTAEDQMRAIEAEHKAGPKKAINYLRRTIGNRFAAGRDVVGKLTGGQEEAAKAYNELYSHLTGHQKIYAQIDAPNKGLQKDYLALGLPSSEKDPFSLWKTYENYNHIINNTTATMENIRAKPEIYRNAYQDIHDYLETNFNKLGLRRNPLSKIDLDITGTQDVMDAIAKSHNTLPAETRIKLERALARAGKLEASELMGERAFSARRYLANPDADIRSAESGIALMRQDLGEAKFKQLQEVSERFHNINGKYLFKVLEDSGLFSDELMNHFKINKNSYITSNVLKYFKDDPKFRGTVQAQYGNLDKTGDELAGTLQKTKAIGMLAEYQKANNAAVEIARLGKYNVKDISNARDAKNKLLYPRRERESVFQQRDRLQKENPENSYIVEFENGKGSLHEIDSPEFARMFEPSALAKNPVASEVLRWSEAYNKLFMERELKTVLSIPFVLRQPFMDRSNEATLARSFQPSLTPFHLTKQLRAVSKRAKEGAKLYQEGIFTKETAEMVDLNAIAFHHAQAFSGHDDASLSASNGFYESMGVRIPGEETVSTSIRVNQKLNKLLTESYFGKKTIGRVRDKAERDEIRTKIASYIIAKEIRGMSPAEAAIVAREYAGTPDPFGGGSELTSLNKLFLFGRAHVNGMRAVYNQFKDDPKGFGLQYAYRKAMPRILVSSAIMGPLVGALFGEKNEKITRAFLNKVPSFDKLSKYITPLGFTDDNGKHHSMFSVDPEEIGPNWKASYFAVPAARELISVDTFLGVPLKAVEEYLDTGVISVKHMLNNLTQAFVSVAGGNIAPGIIGPIRTGAVAAGYNPYDLYRGKGIFPKDVAEAGTVVQKAYEYLLWSAYQTAPGVFSYNMYQQNSTDSLDPLDHIAKIPLVGSTVKAFLRESNYGDYEKSKQMDQRKVEMDADIRLKLGDDSKKLYNEYTKAQSIVHRLGKDWQRELSPEQTNKIHALNNWHARVYRHSFNEMRAAFEKGDKENLEISARDLERASSSYSTMLGRP